MAESEDVGSIRYWRKKMDLNQPLAKPAELGEEAAGSPRSRSPSTRVSISHHCGLLFAHFELGRFQEGTREEVVVGFEGHRERRSRRS